MTQQKDKDTIPAIPTDDILKLLKDYLEMQKKAQENLKRKDLKKGGLVNAITDGIYTGLKYMNDVNPLNQVDKRMDYSYNKKSIPSLLSVINKFRERLNYTDGGSVSDQDIGLTKYFISILENANWLTDFEQKALEELREDLKNMTGVRAND